MSKISVPGANNTGRLMGKYSSIQSNNSSRYGAANNTTDKVVNRKSVLSAGGPRDNSSETIITRSSVDKKYQRKPVANQNHTMSMQGSVVGKTAVTGAMTQNRGSVTKRRPLGERSDISSIKGSQPQIMKQFSQFERSGAQYISQSSDYT